MEKKIKVDEGLALEKAKSFLENLSPSKREEKKDTTRQIISLSFVRMNITFNKPHYFEGEFVEGKISIKSDRPIPGDFISLEVVGKEKVEHQDGYDSSKVRSYRRTFLQSNSATYDIPNKQLPPGDYEIPFQFALPD